MAWTILHPFQVTIPPGTPQATPLVTPTVFAPNVVERIQWRFPNGCNGAVGIQIGSRNVPVIPGAKTQFFVQSGDTAGFDLEDMPDGGDWSVIGFNTGSFPHTILVTFKVHRKEPEPDIPSYLVAEFAGIMQGGA